jgi:hypothetical protein
MLGARCTRIPLLGRLAVWIANTYGKNLHRAYLLTQDEADELLEIAEGVAVTSCDCRRVFHNCDNPLNTEILLGPSRKVFLEEMPHDAREINKDEARDILIDCHQRRLVPTILKCRGDFYAICNCCSCCCLPLRLSKQYGIGNAVIRHKDIIGEFREYQHSYRAGKS